MSIDCASSILNYRLNSFPSDKNFKKSCEMMLTKCKRLEARTLSSILAYDDPESPWVYDGKHTYAWYFAIGSMVNPVSLYLRDITPLISYPAKCPNHRLVFREPCGMADIQFSKGKEFDGVVHLLSLEQMLHLDEVEHMYKRMIVKIIDYQQCPHLVYVYKMNLIGQKEKPIGLPTERYLDIIVKGCEYFGVRSSYVNHLKYDQPVIPRKSPTAYQTIVNVPDNVYYSNDDLLKHDGKNPMLPLWVSINGKILEHLGLPPYDHPDYENQKKFYDFILSYFGGRDMAYGVSRAWYEPMYKVPLNEEDLSDEQRAFAEDMCVCWGMNDNEQKSEVYWRPIGRIDRVSKMG